MGRESRRSGRLLATAKDTPPGGRNSPCDLCRRLPHVRSAASTFPGSGGYSPGGGYSSGRGRCWQGGPHAQVLIRGKHVSTQGFMIFAGSHFHIFWGHHDGMTSSSMQSGWVGCQGSLIQGKTHSWEKGIVLCVLLSTGTAPCQQFMTTS